MKTEGYSRNTFSIVSIAVLLNYRERLCYFYRINIDMYALSHSTNIIFECYICRIAQARGSALSGIEDVQLEVIHSSETIRNSPNSPKK